MIHKYDIDGFKIEFENKDEIEFIDYLLLSLDMWRETARTYRKAIELIAAQNNHKASHKLGAPF